MTHNPHFFSVSENSLTLSFGNEISEEINQKILNLSDLIGKNPFPGLTEIVPAFSSLTVFYNLSVVRKSFPEFSTAFAAVKVYLEKVSNQSAEIKKNDSRIIEISFDYNEEFAPDLNFISETKNLAKEKIIEIFTARTYRVFMLGFLPGFAYMGEIDQRIAVPRKETPRLKVPQGSVGIAGNQTGIYPLESPGGWQIIGKTETELFTPYKKNSTFLQAGDLVKFIVK